MTQLEFSLYSESLGTWTPVVVLLPERKNEETGVLYLLHGLGCDQRKWFTRMRAELAIGSRNLAAVLPYGGRGFYCDMKNGARYASYLAEELPRKLRGMFRLDPPREKTWIAGYSMGGYGAARLGFSRPEQYAGVGILSGVVDVRRLNGEWWDTDARRIWGEDYRHTLPGSEDDPFALVDRLAAQSVRPRVFHACGTEDFLYEDNLAFRRHMEDKGFSYEYRESSGGHDYDFWESQFAGMIDFLTEENGRT